MTFVVEFLGFECFVWASVGRSLDICIDSYIYIYICRCSWNRRRPLVPKSLL